MVKNNLKRIEVWKKIRKLGVNAFIYAYEMDHPVHAFIHTFVIRKLTYVLESICTTLISPIHANSVAIPPICESISPHSLSISNATCKRRAPTAHSCNCSNSSRALVYKSAVSCCKWPPRRRMNGISRCWLVNKQQPGRGRFIVMRCSWPETFAL